MVGRYMRRGVDRHGNRLKTVGILRRICPAGQCEIGGDKLFGCS
jgi:hypothetical protein